MAHLLAIDSRQGVPRVNWWLKLTPTGRAAVLTFGFILAAWAGVLVVRFPTGEPADWWATSFLAALFVSAGPRLRRIVVPVCLVTEFALLLLAGRPLLVASGLTALTLGEAGLAAALLLRVSKTPRLVSLPQFLKLVVLVIAPAAGAAALAYGLFAAAAEHADFQRSAMRWFAGHGAGMLTSLSLLVILRSPFKARLNPLSRPEKVIYSVVYLLLATSPLNGLGMYLLFLIPPAVGVMAFRLGPRPTAIAILLMSQIAELTYYLTPSMQVAAPGVTKEQATLFGEAYGLVIYLCGLCLALAVYYHVRLKRQLEMRAEAARRARANAQVADRAKTEFLANMSHEIRTPLNGVIGVVSSLAQTELNERQREMVSLIESSGVTLERLVSGILDFSKIEAGRLEVETGLFDLKGELETVIEVFRMQAEEKGLALPVAYGPAARGRFIGDAVRIKQVLGNLLSNAVKFTSCGEVRVAVEVTDPPEPGRPSQLVLEVADTGVGFDASFAGELFQRFRQADSSISRRFGGTGLGLSITRGLVKMMGGDIHAQSEPGRGSRFRVELPLQRDCPLELYDQGRRETAGRGAAPAPAPRGLQGLRVLLAEDHPTNQRVVQLMLAPFGVDVTIVENGEAAVETCAVDRFDLVLMDMQMPVMDGLEATRRIRALEAAGRRTPILAMTANAMRQDREACLAAGMDDFISKPVDPRQFLAVLDRWLSDPAEDLAAVAR